MINPVCREFELRWLPKAVTPVRLRNGPLKEVTVPCCC